MIPLEVSGTTTIQKLDERPFVLETRFYRVKRNETFPNFISSLKTRSPGHFTSPEALSNLLNEFIFPENTTAYLEKIDD